MDFLQAIARPVNAGRSDFARNRFFTQLVEQRGAAAFHTAFRLLGTKEEAHDAVQDALTKALDRLPDVQQQDQAAAWLFRVLVNVCMSRLRRRAVVNRALAIVGRGELASCAPASGKVDFAHSVMPGLAKLPVKQRTAMILRYGDERTIAEIADAMKVSPETVKTHLRRGLTTIRGKLGVPPGGSAQ